MDKSDDQANERVSSWREWDKRWLKTITRSSGFEWNFAKKVIQIVPGLNPNSVTPQKAFVSNEGRELHMDFAIEVDGVRIAIEVEGWDKTGEQRGKNKEEHDDFNRRIQSLEADGWRVMTVTNAQFMADPGFYASQIRVMLLDREAPKAENTADKLSSTPPPRVEVGVQRGGSSEQENGAFPKGKLIGSVVLIAAVVAGFLFFRGGGSEEIFYESCGDVRAAGAAPIRVGDPGFSERFDGDGDGVGCEIFYESCDDVRAAGAAPIRVGDPGFIEQFDGDGDGVGCE